MTTSTSFRFRFGAWRPLLSALAMGPGSSRVELDGDTLHVVDPPVRARATGLPIELRELTLSLEDPDALSVALGH